MIKWLFHWKLLYDRYYLWLLLYLLNRFFYEWISLPPNFPAIWRILIFGPQRLMLPSIFCSSLSNHFVEVTLFAFKFFCITTVLHKVTLMKRICFLKWNRRLGKVSYSGSDYISGKRPRCCLLIQVQNIRCLDE